MDENLTTEDLLTAQEQWMKGERAGKPPFDERLWYIPQGVLKGLCNIKEAIALRGSAGGHFESVRLAEELDFKNGLPISIKFSDIDEKKMMTLSDPEVIGQWDESEGKIIKIEGRDLTQEVYAMLKKKYGVDLRLRPTSGVKEKVVGSSSEKIG